MAQGNTSTQPIASAAADDSAKALKHVSGIDTKAAAERRDVKHQEVQQSLATTAPETAGAIPAEEQPQQPEAAAHQEETLTNLEAGSADPTGARSEKLRLARKLKRQRRQKRKAETKAAAAAEVKREQPAEKQADDLVAAAAATAASSDQQASTAPGQDASASTDSNASATSSEQLPLPAGQQAAGTLDQQPASATSSQKADALPWRQQQRLAAHSTQGPSKVSFSPAMVKSMVSGAKRVVGHSAVYAFTCNTPHTEPCE